MSLSNQQPSPLVEFSQLCKTRNAESFSETFHCMESQKDLKKTEFEWQRTEGKLNEIGLNVNSGGAIKDGLIKNASFTDEDKLCFFEGGKLDKELKTQQDKREIEAQHKGYQASTNLESRALISETFPVSEGSSNSEVSDIHLEQTVERLCAGLANHEAITDQEKAEGGGTKMETRLQDQKLPSLSISVSDPVKYMKEQETSVWNPNFSPDFKHSVAQEEPVNQSGTPSYCVIGVVNDNYVRCGYSSPPTLAKLDLPTTSIELVQDDSKTSHFSCSSQMEEERLKFETEEAIYGTDEGILRSRASHQRKAMRRAMSECSHLSVPLTLNMADKYPEPHGAEGSCSGLLSPTNSMNQNPSKSPAAKKVAIPMKRSMTMAEEQTSVHIFTADQHGGGLPSLLIEEQSSANKALHQTDKKINHLLQKELVSSGSYHIKLEQIPEGISSINRKQEEANKNIQATNEAVSIGTLSTRSSEVEHQNSEEPSRNAPLGKEIEVTDVQNTPSSLREKTEALQPHEFSTGVDIIAPPNKELPPSPEKKAKSVDTKSPLKSPEKRIAVSKTPTTSGTNVKASPVTPKTPTSVSVDNSMTGSGQKTTASMPKRPTAFKTDVKPADTKKSGTIKSTAAELSRPKTSPVNSGKSNATTPTTPGGLSSTGAVANHPKPLKPAPAKSASNLTTDTKKLSTVRVLPPKPSTMPKQTRPVSAPAPDMKNVRSKIGSTDNIKHQPGGGKVLIQTKKVDISKVSSKCGSKTNIKHKPGGGDVKIESHKINLKGKMQAKVGSLDNVGHVPAGGNVKTEGSEEAGELAQTPENGVLAVPQGLAGSETRENGVGEETVPTEGGDQREIQSFSTQIQETN